MRPVVNTTLAMLLSLSAFADNPFSKFSGKYEVRNCTCIGDKSGYTYEPCNLTGVLIRSYDVENTQKAWVLDELRDWEYTIRPLDERSLRPFVSPSKPVSISTTGDASQAIARVLSASSMSNYEIRKQASNFQYVAGFKGTSRSGAATDVQCYYDVVKK